MCFWDMSWPGCCTKGRHCSLLFPMLRPLISGATADMRSCLVPAGPQWDCASVQAESESSTDYSGDCVSTMIGSGQSTNTILGAPFLRGFFSVYQYDMSSKAAQVGFAPAAAS